MHLNCSSLPALDPVGQSDHTGQMGTVSFVNTGRVTRKDLKWCFMAPSNVIPVHFLLWLLRVGWLFFLKGQIAPVLWTEDCFQICTVWCHQTVTIKYRCLYSQPVEDFQTAALPHAWQGRVSCTNLYLVPLLWSEDQSFQ